MFIPQRDLATSQAANIVLTALVRTLADVSSPKKEIIKAVLPIFGIRWNATVIRRVGKEKLRKILWSLRNSKLDLGSYLKVRALWLSADVDEAIFPQRWEPWLTVIERFNLDSDYQLSSWVPVIDTFEKRGWNTPNKLALINHALLQAALADYPQREQALQLWTATVLLFPDLSPASYLILLGASSDAEKLTRKLRTAPLRIKAVIKDTNRGIPELRLSKNSPPAGPGCKACPP